MIAGMLEWLVQILRLGAEKGTLARALHPLGGPRTAPRVLLVNRHLARPLRAAGYEVQEKNQAEPPDALCAAQAPPDLIGALSGWARQVRQGGMVLLVTLRGRPARAALCAAFLHAGLAEPLQETRGLVVVTAGRAVKPR